MFIIYLLVGCFAGLSAGLLGVGGGLLIVPALAWIFAAQGFSDAIVMHLAIGTSLATIVITSISSMRAHHQHHSVRWRLVLQLSFGIIVGAWVGAAAAHVMQSAVLVVVFGFFELFVAAQLLLGKPPAAHRQLPKKAMNIMTGAGIGGVSAILGIGGGTLTVPYLVWHNVPMREAVGTSSACGFPIALAGAVGFIVMGWKMAELPAYSSGYVYWPAAGAIVLSSVLAAPVGAKLAHTVSQAVLKKTFGIFLVILGLLMLSGAMK
ncbi:MAG: sulfite exporter TauE/SafE family protein [Gammaproteobacteria bacterium]